MALLNWAACRAGDLAGRGGESNVCCGRLCTELPRPVSVPFSKLGSFGQPQSGTGNRLRRPPGKVTGIPFILKEPGGARKFRVLYRWRVEALQTVVERMSQSIAENGRESTSSPGRELGQDLTRAGRFPELAYT